MRRITACASPARPSFSPAVKRGFSDLSGLSLLVDPLGFEPRTRRLRVGCSTI